LIIGIGSKLIPMFLISKYKNHSLLWVIYSLINLGLISLIIIFYSFYNSKMLLISWILTFTAIVLFIYFLYKSYKQRIRKKVDGQMKISLLSILLLIAPMIILALFLLYQIFINKTIHPLVVIYGFLLFFGWMTSIIVGMTFKTLPFIIWNKVYSGRARKGVPNFQQLFSHKIFAIMTLFYWIAIVVFSMGIVFSQVILLNIGSLIFLVCATLYNWNVLKIIFHKSKL
ncbi:MAG: cytochrome C oxidase subunit I, partial [Chitinophagaceae bacterium]